MAELSDEDRYNMEILEILDNKMIELREEHDSNTAEVKKSRNNSVSLLTSSILSLIMSMVSIVLVSYAFYNTDLSGNRELIVILISMSLVGFVMDAYGCFISVKIVRYAVRKFGNNNRFDLESDVYCAYSLKFRSMLIDLLQRVMTLSCFLTIILKNLSGKEKTKVLNIYVPSGSYSHVFLFNMLMFIAQLINIWHFNNRFGEYVWMDLVMGCLHSLRT